MQPLHVQDVSLVPTRCTRRPAPSPPSSPPRKSKERSPITNYDHLPPLCRALSGPTDPGVVRGSAHSSPFTACPPPPLYQCTPPSTSPITQGTLWPNGPGCGTRLLRSRWGGPRHWQEHAYAAGRGEEDGGGGRGGRDCTLMLQVGGGCVCRWGWGGASEAKGTEALVATTVCFACS